LKRNLFVFLRINFVAVVDKEQHSDQFNWTKFSSYNATLVL
jgi:hypothetical protein